MTGARTVCADAAHANSLAASRWRESQMSAMGQIRPSCAVPTDGSLSPDSCRARRMLLTAESGQFRTTALQ